MQSIRSKPRKDRGRRNQRMKFLGFGQTHRGRVRERNEDAFLVRPDLGFFAVADGVGGLPDGDFASAHSLELLADQIGSMPPDAPVDLAAMLRAVNRSILLEGGRRHPRVGIGTTLTCFIAREGKLRFGHVGDSMACRLRGNDLRTLTTEHTVAAEIQGLRESVPSETMPQQYFHTLTRCIGESEPLHPEIIDLEAASEDRFLLATDGLSKVVRRPEIHAILSSAKTPEDATEALIKKALAMGAPDNVGLVAVFVA